MASHPLLNLGSTTPTASLDEILFRNRNRAYGAYQLRVHHTETTLRAFVYATGLITLLMCALLLSPAKQKEKIGITLTPVTSTLTQNELDKILEATQLARAIPAPLQPDLTPRRQDVVPTTIVPDEEAPREQPRVETQPETPAYTADGGTGPGTVQGDPDGSENGTERSGNNTGNGNGTVAAEPGLTEFVDLTAEPAALNMKEFKRKVGYPTIPKEAGIEGKLVVRVLVNTDGTYLRHVVLRSPHPAFTQEVARHLPLLRFSPGMQGTHPVKVWVTLPVDFKLK